MNATMWLICPFIFLASKLCSAYFGAFAVDVHRGFGRNQNCATNPTKLTKKKLKVD
jgi:hypothetical protein